MPLKIVSLLLVASLLAGCAAPAPRIPAGVQADSNGRYTVVAVPKVEGHYQRVNADTVRVFPFAIYRLASEDADNFYVKMYEPVAQPVPQPLQHPIRAMTPLPRTQRLAFSEALGDGLPKTGQWRETFAIADMNGDGRPDIVLAPARKTLRPPSIYLNEGDGSFRRWTDVRFPPLPYDYGAVAVADFNGDGHPDIAIAEHLVGVGVLLGDGKGGFTAFNEGLPEMKPGSYTDQSFSAKAIRAVDWDGDGRVDLVVQQEPGGGKSRTTKRDNLVVFLNRGDHWQLLDAGSGEPIPGDRVAIADLNGDGRPDAVLASAQQGEKRLGRINRGDATDVIGFDELPDGAYIDTIAAGDVTGDGKADVVVGLTGWNGAQWVSGLDVLVNDGGRFVDRPLWRDASKREGVTAIGIVDLDGDGHDDIVALRNDGELLSFLSDGHGGFTQDATMATPAWRNGCSGADIQSIAVGSRQMLVATFSGEPSAYEIPPRCRNEGGVALISVTVAR